MMLPPPLDRYYARFEKAISARLAEFAAPKSEKEIFYELCYCICTPQSKAQHALHVVEQLEQQQFFERPFDPTPLLAQREHYIRFHRTKAARLLGIRDQFPAILAMLRDEPDPRVLRAWVATTVPGLGFKEASHVLRNLGYADLAILDRHILRNLARYGVIADPMPPRTRQDYEVLEERFQNFAIRCGLPLQALDLLLWAIETGLVLK